ncbi:MULTISPECIES: DUF4232 domain-containing protein [unclassified Streptomyces]|uniref:DUF4232 domain-containing protein n=1 Tax=unclassified Streptomyces TaxID=2593676 RepID=UPI002E81F001|nr:DUF4232 domain-containing protein [Streptomyces sp. NBC_00589]WTI37712.1 DUF4232 domain-containing protein [Streptomyces sp. NBC_00775]WUB28609.1 DUF4232 domain-containing protein [Streptomyces sp. NBC_00589]
MSNLRASRTRLVSAAATAVLAALSLTACNDGTGARDEGASATTTTANSPSGVPTSTSGSGSGSNSPSSSSSSASSGGKPATATTGPATDTSASKTPVSSGKPVTCEGSNTKTVAAPLNRPVNHMLLTVTNTGGKTCYLYGYPAIRFGEAQAVPPVIEESQPQAVVTLQPGESGYASVSLSATDGSGSNGHTEKSLAVYFRGRSGNESVGAGAHPSLPAKGVYVDDSLEVTYWQQSMDDAVTW